MMKKMSSRNCHCYKDSSIDQRIEILFGHFSQNFHGEISKRNLGPRFGDYGTFLPTRLIEPKEYHVIIHGDCSSQSPMMRDSATAPTSQNFQNVPARKWLDNFSNHHQNSARLVKTVSEASIIKTSTRRLSCNSSRSMAPKPAEHVKTASAPKLAGTTNSIPMLRSERKGIIKIRIGTGEKKMDSNSKETSSAIISRKEELYHSLGLNLSPYSSPETEPHESISCSSQVSRVRPAEYPTRIIKLMTSCPLSDNPMLSPLRSGITNLLKKRSYRMLSTDLATPNEDESAQAQKKGTSDKDKGTNPDRNNMSNRLVSKDQKKALDRTKEREKMNAQFSEVPNLNTRTDKEKERSPLLQVKDEQRIDTERQAGLHATSVRAVEEKCTSSKQNQLEVEFSAHHDARALDSWVECEKCLKWRVLPYWMDPKNLPSKWTCSKITWLAPGMNSCNISMDYSTAAVNELYLVPQSSQVGKLRRKRPSDTILDHISLCQKRRIIKKGDC